MAQSDMRKQVKPSQRAREKKRTVGRATTRSTAGPGFAFEDQVAAQVLVNMLSGEAVLGVEKGLGWRLQCQSSSLGWLLDDLLVTCGQESNKSHLAVSCKSSVQVTRAGLPSDFVNAAWKQLANSANGPMHRDHDRLILVTRGRNTAFQVIWEDVKNWCASSDSTLALARIHSTKKHRTVFDSIKKIVKKSFAAVADEDVLDLIRHLLVIPTDFDHEASEARESLIAQCRSLLLSGAAGEGYALWEALVDRARKARLGDGTIDLVPLWSQLRGQFTLKDHPDFAGSWRLLCGFSQDHLNKIEVALPTGFALARTEDSAKLLHALDNPIVVLHGDSGTGKSALAKSTIDRNFSFASQIWLGPDELKLSLGAVEGKKIGFAHPLIRILESTSKRNNILVLDAAERIGVDEASLVKQLVNELLLNQTADETPVWRILILGQNEALVDGRLQNLFGSANPVYVELGPISVDEVKQALRSIPRLSWLALQEDAVTVLTNLRALSWVMEAESHFQNQIHAAKQSTTTIADHLWAFWTDRRPTLQKLLMQFAMKDASFERSIALTDLPTDDVALFESRPSQLPLRITSRHRIEFQHDLAAEWARFQRLKEIASEPGSWATLAQNPLWAGALRMLGQFLLREQINNRTGWDIAFEKFESPEHRAGLSVDILLDALCLDPLAESLLTERAELLFANHGSLLNRLLVRFDHIATVPVEQPKIVANHPSLKLYIESQFRTPIIARWPPVARFLSVHKVPIANLMSPVVSKLCERWLTTTPVKLTTATPTPYRRELAELALLVARELQIAQGKHRMFADDSAGPIYKAALAGAPDLPDEVSQWALEMARRRDWSTDVTTQINEYHIRQADERANRLRTDPEYRRRQERLVASIPFIPSTRELPPWPSGPQDTVERGFCEACLHSGALIPLMRTRPDVVAEILLATIIEDSPEEEYDRRYRTDDHWGLEYDHDSYPTAYWQSPFYAFLQVAPEAAQQALIALVEFCTDRWDEERQHYSDGNSAAIVITLNSGISKTFIGNHCVFDWSQENSLRAGQLHAALAALEKWLCGVIESGSDVGAHIDRLLNKSRSVAFLGVLVNVGKFRPALFEEVLRPLLAESTLYFWDDYRIRAMNGQFDAAAWARKGEPIFQMAREWCLAGYRRVPLREIATQLVIRNVSIAEFLGSAIAQWQSPSDHKAALELRLLMAELDHTNYINGLDEASGTAGVHFSYPKPLQNDVREYEQSKTSYLRALTLPMKCREFLSSAQQLTKEQASELVPFIYPGFLGGDPSKDEEDRLHAQIAAAATLLARGRQWLDEDAQNKAQTTISTSVAAIGEGEDVFRNRISWGRHSELEFASHALIQELIQSKGLSAGNISAVLRVLTSGEEAATRTLMLLAYEHRLQLGMMWWRLLHLSLLWCGLAVLAPRHNESTSIQRLWTRWLRWLRSQKLTEVEVGLDRILPLDIAQRVERLQRRRWVREYAQDRSGFHSDPATLQSPGLNTHLLGCIFSWLFQDTSGVAPHLDVQEGLDRTKLLKALLEFELWSHQGEKEREDLPSPMAYELLPAIVRVIPGMSVTSAADLWKPIFKLGGQGHYLVGTFIDGWLRQASQNCAATTFVGHWRAMIEYALASSEWSSGRQWFYGEQLLCRLLGCGSELHLDRVPELREFVWQMRDLYESWAINHLQRDEDQIAYFCQFLSSSTGSLLRLFGLQLLQRALTRPTNSSSEWRRPGTGGALLELMNVTLSQDADKLVRDSGARDALIGSIAMLVKHQVPAALALQERAKKALSMEHR